MSEENPAFHVAGDPFVHHYEAVHPHGEPGQVNVIELMSEENPAFNTDVDPFVRHQEAKLSHEGQIGALQTNVVERMSEENPAFNTAKDPFLQHHETEQPVEGNSDNIDAAAAKLEIEPLDPVLQW